MSFPSPFPTPHHVTFLPTPIPPRPGRQGDSGAQKDGLTRNGLQLSHVWHLRGKRLNNCDLFLKSLLRRNNYVSMHIFEKNKVFTPVHRRPTLLIFSDNMKTGAILRKTLCFWTPITQQTDITEVYSFFNMYIYNRRSFEGTVQQDLFGWKWYQLIGLSLRERRQDFQLILSIPS